MDLYNWTGWGFLITVVSVFLVGGYVRNAIDQRIEELEQAIKEMQKDINRIDGKIPKPFDRWGDLKQE